MTSNKKAPGGRFSGVDIGEPPLRGRITADYSASAFTTAISSTSNNKVALGPII